MSTITSIPSITSDRARVSHREDLYGWSDTFVPMLAKVTRKWPPRDGLTFGVYGPWGSGKSTVLNLLESQLQQDAATYPNTYIVRFNPWFYDSSQALVTSFFASVGSTLKADTGKKWAAAGDLLKKMGKFLAIASKGLTFAGFGYDTTALGQAGEMLKDAAELAESGETPLRKIRDSLIKHLNELGDAGGRIMVLIDDVDRLDGEELLTLLRLLRTVADLPSVTLLVSMDEHRVCDVLNSAAGQGYGRAYLEKIVQAHVHVPMPAEDKLEAQLRTGIVNILTAAGAEIPAFIAEGSVENGTGVLDRIICTPRDLGRYLNGLRILTLARTTWDLNATDAIHLAALHVFYPEVYERVRRSKAYLTNGRTGGPDLALPPRSLDWLTGRENGRMNDPDADEAADLIREMFGEYGKRSSPVPPGPLLDDRRIASASVFHAYFAFDPEPEWIPRIRLRTCIGRLVEAAQSGNFKGFLAAIGEIAADKRLVANLTRSDLISAICALEPKAAARLAECLLDVRADLQEPKWTPVWNAYMASTHRQIEKFKDYEVTQQLSAPVMRWIESSPDPLIRADRNWLYKASEHFL